MRVRRGDLRGARINPIRACVRHYAHVSCAFDGLDCLHLLDYECLHNSPTAGIVAHVLVRSLASGFHPLLPGFRYPYEHVHQRR